MRSSLKIIAGLTLILHVACEEQNPYRDQIAAKRGTAEASEEDASGAGTPSGDSGTGTTEPGQPAASTAADTTTVAKTDDIAKEQLSAAQLVCQDQAMASKYQVEMAVLCLNGQPTQAFANALQAPYKGTGTPTLGMIKSEDNNGISTFVLVSAMEVPLPLMQAFGKRAALNPANFVEGNATVTQTEVAPIAPAGGASLGGFDLRFQLRVSVGIINVNDVRALQRDYATVKDQQVISSVTYLKPGAPDNQDNIVANIISFWIADGNTTKIVGVTHQQADNRGQHATAQTTVQNLGRRTITDSYTAIMR